MATNETKTISSRRRVRWAVASALALATACVGTLPSSAQSSEHFHMELSTGSPRTVSGVGCNWAEPGYPGGSWVDVLATTQFVGGIRRSDAVTLVDARATTTEGGSWELVLPRAALTEVPSWATEIITTVEARCHWAIGSGDGRAYDPIVSERALDRQVPPSTATSAPASSPATTFEPAAAAEPVSGSATFTG